MRFFIVLFLGVALSVSLSQAINFNCELGPRDYLRHELNDDIELLTPHDLRHLHYPYARYGPEAIKVTKTGTTGTVSKTISTLNSGHVHALPGISHHSPLRDSVIIEKQLGGLHNLQGLNHLDKPRGLRGDLHHLHEGSLLGLNRPASVAYEKTIFPRDLPYFGLHQRLPSLTDIEYIRTGVPSSKIVDLEVVRREPVYRNLPVCANSLRSAELAIGEKIRQPSIALKEREAVYFGGERQNSRRISTSHRDGIVKRIELDC